MDPKKIVMLPVLKLILSLLPVFAFLGGLLLFDSFKLVKWPRLLGSILAGCAVALLALLLNTLLLNALPLDGRLFSRYLAPLIEESLKASYILLLIRRHRLGFMVDGAVHGFAVGAGFALVENLYYLHALESSNLLLWAVRGFGTAVMHGGTTAIFAILSKNLEERNRRLNLLTLLPGIGAAIVIHSFFNHFLLSPLIMTAAQLLILPGLIAVAFRYSEKALQEWMNFNLDTDVELFEAIREGKMSESYSGLYLQSLQQNFPDAVFEDMLQLLRLHLELACQAKGILLRRQAGFAVVRDPQANEKFARLEALRRRIGKTGRLALSPILRNSSRDIWQLHLLRNG
ncbi:MAG: PrsW family intramembrane metalloprotease [Calditrichaeota bacterium]|nr:PrsW family intramembrane metalloprotease [Calditrichota bacterium]MCB0292363.1 PrsW family intramembrane metalloprotease [Calditrichota bacterium]MCB0295502.1 PrsW family intramembrane metalloprotease [Calditrichota bacterium]MCB0302197.1 PrsW family intramembrane metalloprotease [Calditrichota bacterium]MCB9090724.1 PrsW family intramembrane metalloprotease [Calditrichia bacterium]